MNISYVYEHFPIFFLALQFFGLASRSLHQFMNSFTLQWTDCIIDEIFKNIEIVKFITTALKSVLKLVKLQSLVAKCCKMQKNTGL